MTFLVVIEKNIINKPNGVLDLQLSCTTTKQWDNVKLRFEVRYQDGAKAGTMFANKPTSFAANDVKTIQMCMDTSHLAPGRYIIDIVAYIFNEFGNEQFLDGVYPGLILDIDSSIDDTNELQWNHMYWGHTHLHDLDVQN